MTNDTKKPGAEPGKSQARLDKALTQLGELKASIERLDANSSSESQQLETLTSSVNGMGEKLAVVDGLSSSVEKNSEELAKLVSAIARRDELSGQREALIDQRFGKLDETLRFFTETLSNLLTSDQSAAAKTGQLVEQTTSALSLLNILATEQRTAAGQYESLSGAVAEANRASSADREMFGTVAAGIDLKLASIETTSTKTIGQVVKLRRQSNHIDMRTTRIERNTLRMLALLDVVIQGIEASQMYLAEVQFSVRRVEKGMLTTKMFFEVNKAMKKDLVEAMNKLPDELKRSTKEILQAAARIKHEAETNAADNVSQMAMLKAQVQQMVNYYSTEGQGVIELLKEASTTFNTKLSNEVGKASLLLEREVETFLEGSRKKLDGFAEQLKASDFHKVLEGLGAAYTNVQNLSKEISKAISELDTAQEEVKAEIQDKVEQIQIATKSLGGDIHNARSDIGVVQKSFGTIREYLVETNTNFISYMEAAKDAHGIAQRMVAADENGKLALYRDLFEKLVVMVVAGVEETQRNLAEQFGLEMLQRDLDSSNETDKQQ
ncbi:hypothetical protein CWC48_29895 [Pseudomonas sp. S10E 269]|uniref:hypothetical protein n=1 Tax=unclassified Pseudomonas TaxID=196821 RepID=UPI000C25FCB0|nr:MULTISPECIES: hypothetical protein [unclassified Pseudomonas]PJK31775.1 hypothetical protein CWC49_29960 [Pseudomonas sp. S09F 262]PJK37543.1 hypothetical protein CWC48_29895 [Pseudomonas sp. S10E 269]